MELLTKDSALSYYEKACEISASPDNIKNKILNFGTILEDVFKEITKNDVESLATLFERQNFIEKNYRIPEIIREYHKVRVISNSIRHNSNYIPNNADYTKSFERLVKTINYFSDSAFPTDIALVSTSAIDGQTKT